MSILESTIMKEMILPFVLIFVAIFAILQKSKILGDKKSQVDALVALVIALIVLAFPGPRDLIVGIMPWLAVGVAVILSFLILYGFAAGDTWMKDKWVKVVFGILAGLFIICVVIYVSGTWNFFKKGISGDSWQNVLLVVVVIGAIAFAIATAGEKKEK